MSAGPLFKSSKMITTKIPSKPSKVTEMVKSRTTSKITGVASLLTHSSPSVLFPTAVWLVTMAHGPWHGRVLGLLSQVH